MEYDYVRHGPEEFLQSLQSSSSLKEWRNTRTHEYLPKLTRRFGDLTVVIMHFRVGYSTSRRDNMYNWILAFDKDLMQVGNSDRKSYYGMANYRQIEYEYPKLKYLEILNLLEKDNSFEVELSTAEGNIIVSMEKMQPVRYQKPEPLKHPLNDLYRYL